MKFFFAIKTALHSDVNGPLKTWEPNIKRDRGSPREYFSGSIYKYTYTFSLIGCNPFSDEMVVMTLISARVMTSSAKYDVLDK